MSCNLLRLEASTEGKVPTTPTSASVIAGIEVQEAVKLLHGLPTLAGRGFVFEGLNHSSYTVEYTTNADCMSHYTHGRIIPIYARSADLTLEDLRARASQDLGGDNVIVEFSRDVVAQLACPACGQSENVFAPVGALTYEQGKCPHDGHMRSVLTAHSYSGDEKIGARKLNELGLPIWDIFVARRGSAEIAYLIAGDAEQVLGPQPYGRN